MYHSKLAQLSLVSAMLAITSAAFAAPTVSIPFVFEKNVGQVDAQVSYFGRTPGAALWLVDSGAVLSVERKNQRGVLRMTLEGARPHPKIDGAQQLPGKSNYFTGRDPAQWRKDIGQYGAVRYREPYPGVDLVFHATGQTIEYDWIVSPGADPRQIRMSFQGASKIRIDRSGDLALSIGDVEVREKRPQIYQEGPEGRKEIDGRFVRRGRTIGFEVADYDRSRPLTIDPVLTYATQLGGSGYATTQSGDYAKAVAVDSQGNVIAVGSAYSQNFPVKNGLYPQSGALLDAFITKLNPAGSAATSVVWSTYFGGSGLSTQAYGVAVDSQNNVYVTGGVQASDLPLMNAFQSTGAINTIPKPSLPVTVMFGTTPSPTLSYVGVAPGEVDGLLQINATVPSGLTPGNVPITVTVGSATSQKGLTIAVH